MRAERSRHGAPAPGSPARDDVGTVVRLAEGHLLAVARRTAGPLPAREEIAAACERLGIVHGLDEAAIAGLCAGRVPTGVEVTIARGAPPTQGVEGRIEYRFVLPDENRAFSAAGEDGSVDFREGMLTEHVTPGAVLAEVQPAQPGIAGATVTDRPLPAPSVRDVTLAVGPNVSLSADGRRAIAMAHGRPTLVGGRIEVVAALEVKAVDYATGNIHFDGPVFVRGDVEAGFSVCATGDIEVGGSLEAGTLISGGNVVIRGGARNHAHVEAAKSVQARFVDSLAELHAVGDVIVQQSAMLSVLVAGRSLAVGRTVSGGLLRAGERIEVRDVGVERGAPTVLEVFREATVAELRALEARLAEVRAALAKGGSGDHSVPLAARKRAAEQEVLAHVEAAFLAAQIERCERHLAMDEAAGEVRVLGPLHPYLDVVIHHRVFAPTFEDGVRRFTYAGEGSEYVAPPWVASLLGEAGSGAARASRAPGARPSSPPPGAPRDSGSYRPAIARDSGSYRPSATGARRATLGPSGLGPLTGKKLW